MFMQGKKSTNIRLYKFVKYFLLSLFFIFISLIGNLYYSYDSMPLAASKVNASHNIVTPLYAKKSDIFDATGKKIYFRGINWFGMEIDTHVPHGLWVRGYKEMLSEIKSLGYNFIRLPYSLQALQSSDIKSVNFSIGSNKDLQDKTPLEVLDIIIQEAQRQGLFILLDNHCLRDNHISELWYGDGFTEKDWIDTWSMLARRYRNQSNVIGADLKNEPHGRASWGTGDKQTDWRLAAERAGNKILDINPDWLILVEGVEKNVPNQKQSGYFWGANLEGVRYFPVRLSSPEKLVYSPHEYGGSSVAWFLDSKFPNNLYERWEKGFHYIATKNIAPILVGEFGGYHVDKYSKEGIWQRKFVNYLKKNNLHFAYWCWNPNSKGTGGILKDDWKTINRQKQSLLNKVL